MILVGLDFSEGSWAALAHARALSRATGLPVEALHVADYGAKGRWQPGPEHLAWMERAGLHPAACRARTGVPWVELVRWARDRGATFIVAGRHGGSGFQPLSLGSTALRLATSAPNPVLLVSGPPTLMETAAPAAGEVGEVASPPKIPHGDPTRADAG